MSLIARTFIRRGFRTLGYSIERIGSSSGHFDPRRSIVTHHEVGGTRYSWFVENPRDSVQSHHAVGTIYEHEDLIELGRRVGPIGTFVDVGANVGNHSIFVLKSLGANRVIAFEPARKQHDILAVNIALNGVGESIVVHKCALSDRTGEAFIATDHADNLGGASVNDVGRGELIQIRRGDDILGDEDVTCIKIDAEGHEMQALAGLEATIARTRPFIFVEVDNANLAALNAWAARRTYAVVWEFRRYSSNLNILLQPSRA